MATRHHYRCIARRRVRLRWLTIVSGVAVVIATMLVLSNVGRAWRRHVAAHRLLQAADEQERSEHWLTATESIEAYLKLRPDAADQRVRLARLAARGTDGTGQRERAIDLLYRALGVCESEERLALQSHLANLLLTEDRFSEAETVAGQIIQAQPENALALRVRALGLLRQYQRGSFDHRVSRNLPVVAWLDEARRANPTDIELAELTAAAYRDFGLGVPGRPTATEREGLADACLDDLLRARQHDPLVYLARHHYRTRYAVGDASAELAKALSLAPESPEVLLAVASAAQQRAKTLCESDQASPLGLNEFAKATELYRRVIENSAETAGPQPYLELGDALLALGESAQALATWDEGREKFPGSRTLFNARLADAHLAAHDPQQAAPHLDAIDLELTKTNTVPDHASLSMARDQSLRRGLWLIQREQPRDAIPQFQRVITLQELLGGHSRQATRAWEQLGHASAALAKWSDAASAFDYACLEHPQSGELWLLASQAHIAAKHYDVAVERAHQAVRQDPSCIAHLNLAGALLQQQLAQPPSLRRWRRAESALEASRELADDGTLPDLKPLELLGRELRSAKADSAGSASSKLSLWQWHHQEWPSLPAIHRLFVTAERNTREPLTSPAGSVLSFESALQLSRVQAMRGEYDLAEEMLLQSAADHSPAERAVIDRELIQNRLARGDVKEAHMLLSTLVRASPDIEPLRQMAAEVEIEHDRRVRAEEEEETFLP